MFKKKKEQKQPIEESEAIEARILSLIDSIRSRLKQGEKLASLLNDINQVNRLHKNLAEKRPIALSSSECLALTADSFLSIQAH